MNDNLPAGKDEKEKNQRKKMFSKFDNNGNGYCSLAEIDKGFNDLGEPARVIYLAKAPMLRAFQAAKDYSKSTTEVGDDYVTAGEFRIFLLYMRQYFEYFVMFKKIDTSGDNRIGIEEFK